MENWTKQLEPIINEYSEGGKLTSTDVEELTRIIKAKINLQQDNITEETYNKILDVTHVRAEMINRASGYLSSDDVEADLKLIEQQAEIDGGVPLEYVYSITVWEAVVGRYTVDEFLSEIE